MNTYPGGATEGRELLSAAVEGVLKPALSNPFFPPKVVDQYNLVFHQTKRAGLQYWKPDTDYRVFVRNERVVGGMVGTSTSLISDVAVQLSWRKTDVLTCMEAARIPVSEGRSFAIESRSSARSYAGALGGLLAVKPEAPAGGGGVYSAVRMGVDWDEAWKSATHNAQQVEGPNARVRVERHYDGVPVRAFIVGEELVAAVARVPFFGAGDGRRPLVELVREKLEERRKHLYLRSCLPDTEGLVGNAAQSVPDPGKTVFLHRGAATTEVTVPADITELLSQSVRDLAIEALWSLPGCAAAGVDMVVPNLAESEGAVLLGVDLCPDYRIHHYPAYGSPRYVTSAVVNHMARTGGY